MPSAPIINRVPPEFRIKLHTPLENEAASALRQMGANRLLRPVMTPATEQQLIDAGYARRVLGGVALNDLGQIRAAMENGQ